jgi:hypothetical protein
VLHSLQINRGMKTRILWIILVTLSATCVPHQSSSQVFQDSKAIRNELIRITNRLRVNSGLLTELLCISNSIGKSAGSNKDRLSLTITKYTLQYIKHIIDDSIGILDVLTSDLLRYDQLSNYTAFFVKDLVIKRDAVLNNIEFMEAIRDETKNHAIIQLMNKAEDAVNQSQELFDTSIKRLLVLKAAQ